MKNLHKKLTITFVGIALIVTYVGSNFAFANVTNKIPTPIALYEDSLASAITPTATSFDLVRGTDIVGTSLATSTYGFIIDEGSASQEFVLADCTATVCTNVMRGISPITGTTTVLSLEHAHRRGAVVKMTDAPILLILKRLLNGEDTLPNIVAYLTHPTFTTNTQIVDKKYVDDTAIAGGAHASSTTEGITKLSLNPVSPTAPIAVGDNDTRIPIQGQKDALAGTSGTPSSTNKYITNDDSSTTTISGSKVIRANGGAYPAGDGSAITGVVAQHASDVLTYYTFGESITAGMPVYLKESDGKVYKASAATTNEAFYNYIGIAYESGVTNDSKRVATVSGTAITVASLGTPTETITETAAASTGATGNTTSLYSGNIVPTQGFITGNRQLNITKISVNFAAATGTGGGNVTMKIYPVSSITNSTLTLGSALYTSALVISPGAGDIDFTFTGATVTPNTQYAYELTSSAGNSTNHYNVTYDQSGTIIGTTPSFFELNDHTSTTVNATNTIVKYTVYYTSKFNYNYGDNVYLADTAGGINLVDTGTNALVLGRIVSSTSIIIDRPTGNRLISSQDLYTVVSGWGSLTTSPGAVIIPRNTTRILIKGISTTSGGVVFYRNFSKTIADGVGTTTPFEVTDATSGTTNLITYANISSWSTYILYANTIITSGSGSATIYFYR